MNADFGIANAWTQGDFVTRTVAVILLLMSVASWTLIVLKSLDLLRYKKLAQQAQDFWHSKDLASGLKCLSSEPANPFRQMVEQGVEADSHHRDSSAELQDALGRDEWLTRNLRQVLDDFTARLQAGLAVLASVGSTAPFIGLFGTVWGIYHALVAISATGQASIDKVAGPVGEALIMTAFGLAVAIPAVLGYNALLRGNKGVQHKLGRFAHDLHAYLMTGSRVARTAPARVPQEA